MIGAIHEALNGNPVEWMEKDEQYRLGARSDEPSKMEDGR
jgi:hypothetical protein